MSKPNRNKIYDAVIRRMVTESLAQKEEQFAQEHRSESNEQLLFYLQEMARQLGHTPWPKEIVGWKLITERFGSWVEAVRQAGLPQMRTPNSPSKFQLYIDEVELQRIAYRINRSEKKARAIQRNNAKTGHSQETQQPQKENHENNPETVQIDNQ